MDEKTSSPRPRGEKPQWFHELKQFREGAWARAVLQLANTVLPYLGLLAVMGYGMLQGWPYWSLLLIAVPAALFLVRTFIIFHDCAHGSFFPSTRANRIAGFVTGVLTFTPYEAWRRSHLKHHATNGQLDHRGVGDIMTMTYEEYRDATRWRRLQYRLYRNPIVLFVLGPFYNFLIVNRFAGLDGTARERRNVHLTNLTILALAGGISAAFGVWTYVGVQLPVILTGGAVGIWLFYVQHQFEPGYWAHDDAWNQLDAALLGASHYKLPPVLRWFTGNIGIHHLHHLQPRIPNYRLRRAYLAFPEARVGRPLTLWRSFRSVRANLWSELEARFLSFREAHRMMRRRAQT
ncbi:MAG: fatty acid desaturase [Spirochaetia bacterium]